MSESQIMDSDNNRILLCFVHAIIYISTRATVEERFSKLCTTNTRICFMAQS